MVVKAAEHRKDTALSWLILAAAFCTQATIFGLVLCTGIYLVYLVDHFQCSNRDAAFIGSIAYGTTCLTSLAASILYRRFGCRRVVMCGGVIASLGCFLSYFATKIQHLYLTYGLLNGIGMGLAYTPTLSVLPDYFDRWRFFASAFATVGSACGTFVFQPIFYRLIETYTWQGSMLINAGIALHIVLFGSILHSRTPKKKKFVFGDMVEISLWKDYKFIILLVECTCWGGCVNTVFSLINSLIVSHGLSKQESTMLAATIGLCSTIGRSSSSVIGQMSCTNRPLLYSCATCLIATGAFAATLCSSFYSFIPALGTFGLGFGLMLSQLPGVNMDLFGVDRLVNAMGYTVCAVGVGGLMLPPIAATFSDSFGIDTGFYLAGSVGLLAVSLAFLTTAFRFKEHRADALCIANL